MTRSEILVRITGVLSTQFEVDPDRVRLETHLFDELELDSLDAIDLAVTLEEQTGLRLSEEELRLIRRVEDVVELVHRRQEAEPAA